MASAMNDRTRDRRTWPRVPPAHVRWASCCRFRTGRSAYVLDLSPGGSLVETRTPLQPGASVTIQMETPHGARHLTGTIVRCWVWAIDREHGPVYRAGIRFGMLAFAPREFETQCG